MYIVLKRKMIIKYILAVLLITSICSIFYFWEKSDSEPVSGEIITTDNSKSNSGQAVYVMAENSKTGDIKNDRDTIRSKTTQILTDALENENVSSEIKKEAENELIAIAGYIDTEMKIESILAAKGFDDTVVFISDNIVTVTVDKPDLNQNDIYKIKDLVYEYSGNNNIKIVEVE